MVKKTYRVYSLKLTEIDKSNNSFVRVFDEYKDAVIFAKQMEKENKGQLRPLIKDFEEDKRCNHSKLKKHP